MALHVVGLIAVILLYLAILLVGVWAAWRNRKGKESSHSEVIMVARRDIGFFLGTFTLTATWVGGGYINGSAEAVYAPGLGLIWTQAPWCLAIGVILTGLFIAEKMRDACYITMLDPLQYKLGDKMGALMFLPALCGDLFWAASILAALGGTLAIILNVDVKISIIASSCISVFYTLVGGLYAVAYTDVVQLLCMFGGLWLCVPFAMMHPAVEEISTTSYSIGNVTGWLGVWEPEFGWEWFDLMVALIAGAVPWQVYYQRIHACKDPKTAKILSVLSAVGFLILTVPPVLIGAIAASADWNKTTYGLPAPAERNEASLILPLAMRYLTPAPVAIIGLGAVSSAVMSSTDSITLSSASMFSHNVYKKVIRPQATDREIVWTIRIAIVVIGTIACVIALTATSVYGLFVLCVDVVFVTLTPQIVSVLFLDINTYGSLPAYFVGFVLRLGGGEQSFNMPPFIHYPGGKHFPFRTFAALMSLVTLLFGSYVSFSRILCRTRVLLLQGHVRYRTTPTGEVFTRIGLTGPRPQLVANSMFHTSSILQKTKTKKGKKMEVFIDPRDAADFIDLDAVLQDMTNAVEKLKKDYVHDFRVGIDPKSLSNMEVNLEGMKVKLQEVAKIQKKSDKSIELDFVSFPEAMKPAILAIQTSSLNLNPTFEGTKLQVRIPAITAEHRKGIAKNAKSRMNESKEEIRKIRNAHERKLKSFENLPKDTDMAIRKQIGVYVEMTQTEAEKAFKVKEKDLLLQ